MAGVNGKDLRTNYLRQGGYKMRIVKTKVYKFDELSDRAKEGARDWYREGGLDYEWWDAVYEDATRMFSFAGFRIDRIYFSGFSSQGDGACFEGSWYPSDVKPGEMEKEAPKDKELHRIANEAVRLAKTGAAFTVKQSGHYQHEMCTAFSIDIPDEIPDNEVNQLEEDLKEMARDAMRWIYRTLEKEYDYLNANEQVDETIRANEYEFTADGERA